MGRVKEIQDKQLAPRLDVDASKRFVRNALWDAAQKASTPKAVKSTCLSKIIHVFNYSPKNYSIYLTARRF